MMPVQLIRFNLEGGVALAQCTYDGDGMRVSKVSNGDTIVYHYDRDGRVISETSGSGALLRDHVYANGKLVVRMEPNVRSFYHTDPPGTPLAMTDASGKVVWRAEYKPFGEEHQVAGAKENDLRFVGKEKETGLLYFGARYMESMIGRFISPDPVGAVDEKTGKVNQMIIHDPQRLNYYAYGLNNPYKYVDPDGEFAIAIAIPVLAAYAPIIKAGIEAAVITGATYLAAKAAVEIYEAGAKNKEAETNSQRGMNNPKTREAVEKGREAHEEFKDKVQNKPGWKSEPTIKSPEGETLRPMPWIQKGGP